MNKVLSTALAFVVGAALGVFVSFTVNCTLVEISINPFFAFYFGFLFCLIALLILYRVKNGDHPKPRLLLAFAGLVLIAGCLCFLLEQNWFLSTHPMWKVPLYAVLGVAVCFALLFTLVDLVNHFCWQCRSNSKHPLVETELQVMLVVGSAIILGAVFGLIFGLMDVEDAARAHDKMAFLRTESICYPIGALLGGLSAVVNEHLRTKTPEFKFDPLADTEYDDEEEY